MAAHMSWLFSGEPVKQAGDPRSHFMPDAAVWTYLNASGDIQEAGRGWEKDKRRTEREREKMNGCA